MRAGRGPNVLVLGTLLGQPMGGVRRHNAELLPRAAALLAEKGGSLSVMEGLDPPAMALPARIARFASDALAHPLLIRWISEGPAVRRTLAQGDPAFDLVHTAHLPAPARLRIPFTLTVHDLRHLETRSARRVAARLLLANAVQRAAGVLAVSESVREAILERFRLDPTHVIVVPNAADHFDPLPRQMQSGEILYVGHLEPRKNLDVVLRALAADPGLPPLALAGAAKGYEAERLRSLAQRLGVSARVRFVGPFDESQLARLYARAACAVLPSKIEGFGIPALEAQRARVPLAIARAGALPEVAGPTTPSFAPNDPAECARAIRSALAATRESLDRAAANADRFRWDLSARILVDAWCEAAARNEG